MPVPPMATWPKSRPMPDYRALLAVDAQGFTALPGVQHAPVSRRIPELVDQALTTAGLTELRDAKAFPESTGDGFVFGFAPALLPQVTWPFLDVLNDVLGAYNSGTAGPRIRLRAVLHVGALPDHGLPGDGVGVARNDTHRLLDSGPVKDYLARSCAQSTPLVAIISQRVYEDVVLAGYSGLSPSRCIAVSATVEGKGFTQPAWVYIPSPSGNLFSSGPPERENAEAPVPDEPLPRTGRNGDVRQWVGSGAAITGDVTGGVHLAMPAGGAGGAGEPG